ncbi:MAG: TRAP transporter substrate-binding protein DctP [Campylobacterales bacterium]|nr:TRAP transporter substrate-binding protein DctP [Campylobacterales bacterium]
MDRRAFFQAGATLSTALIAQGCNSSGRQAIDERKQHELKQAATQGVNINRNQKVTLKLATSWPAGFLIMGTGVERFVQMVSRASGGTLEIKLFPKDTLIPALAVFDAASSGQIDCFHSGPYYWKGKNSAFSLFSGIPFGFTAEEINSWIFFGGGLELWRELYAQHNLYPFVGGNTNIQMGGWFRKPIHSLDDLRGLKMRIPGLGGELFSELGVNPVLLSAGEIYTSLERGVIDATEWVGPFLDLKMGFYKVAPYYYAGWHEPGSILELTFNKRTWEKLSDEHQAIIEMAANDLNATMTTEFHARDITALKELKNLGVQIASYPSDVIEAGKKALSVVLRRLGDQNADFARIRDHAQHYLDDSKAWSEVSLKNFLNIR